MKFELSSEYIELNKLLKLIGWVESGGLANAKISEGVVKVNNEIDTRKRKKLRANDVVEYNNQQITIV